MSLAHAPAYNPDSLAVNFDPETRAHWAQNAPRGHSTGASGVEVLLHHGRVE